MYAIKNAEGRKFNIRVVFAGDRYGLDDRLEHDSAEPMIEFYDAYHGDVFGPRGQFVSRYMLGTLSSHEGGLSLDGGVPEWSLDSLALRDAMHGVWGIIAARGLADALRLILADPNSTLDPKARIIAEAALAKAR